ncbi:hypothetical protein [Streptomyces sp. NPDC059918]|uniref:hypothetical protein n=1 Tax=unclassified Streptomyces TaxID=2593676 RepID=UPI00364D8B83
MTHIVNETGTYLDLKEMSTASTAPFILDQSGRTPRVGDRITGTNPYAYANKADDAAMNTSTVWSIDSIDRTLAVTVHQKNAHELATCKITGERAAKYYKCEVTGTPARNQVLVSLNIGS